MSTLVNIDAGLFYFFNSTLTAPFLDALVSVLAKKWFFLGLAALAGATVFFLGPKDLKWSVVLGVFVFFVSDATVLVLKELLARTRPCHALEGVRVIAGCSSSYSLPSRHATDMFAVMVLLTVRYRAWSPAFLTAAVVVGWSRVYAGQHYPLDVAAGAVMGSGLAACVFMLDKRFEAQRLMDYLKRVKLTGHKNP